MRELDAPLYEPLMGDTPNGGCYWKKAKDGIKLRLGYFPAPFATRGTVFIFQGRTEAIEKYLHIINELSGSGFSSITLDWRGQGLSERLADDPWLGHIDDFSDYQKDVLVLLASAEELDVPKPWFLLAHSMGGAIGFRSISENSTFSAAALTAPMLDIYVPQPKRFLGICAAHIFHLAGWRMSALPGSNQKPDIFTSGFRGNLLTSNETLYQSLQNLALRRKELCLGAPSVSWIIAALKEIKHLRTQDEPNQPCLMLLGDREKIVDPKAIMQKAKNWSKSSELLMLDGAKHEILLEKEDIRHRALKKIIDWFDQHSP